MIAKQVDEAASFLKQRGFGTPQIGIILGSGLGRTLDKVSVEKEMSYNHIPFFPTATVEFHTGKLIYGELAGKKVILMQGRFHVYEGYSLQDVTFPVRVMHKMGVEKLLVSNASGAINNNLKKGELMLLDDHINLQGGSPLAFKGVEQLGTRFVDMSAPYDTQMNASLERLARENGITLHKGVYASVVGPQLETRAEYRYLRTIGADAVGMSTVPEVIVANHLGLPVSAISVLTDECDPDNLQPIAIDEILEIAAKAEPDMITLFTELIRTL
jgi:purine-nucleoside phosphorylase